MRLGNATCWCKNNPCNNIDEDDSDINNSSSKCSCLYEGLLYILLKILGLETCANEY